MTVAGSGGCPDAGIGANADSESGDRGAYSKDSDWISVIHDGHACPVCGQTVLELNKIPQNGQPTMFMPVSCLIRIARENLRTA